MGFISNIFIGVDMGINYRARLYIIATILSVSMAIITSYVPQSIELLVGMIL